MPCYINEDESDGNEFDILDYMEESRKLFEVISVNIFGTMPTKALWCLLPQPGGGALGVINAVIFPTSWLFNAYLFDTIIAKSYVSFFMCDV